MQILILCDKNSKLTVNNCACALTFNKFSALKNAHLHKQSILIQYMYMAEGENTSC